MVNNFKISLKKDAPKWYFWVGVLMIGLESIFMLFLGLPEESIKFTAWFNLFALFLIIKGVWK